MKINGRVTHNVPHPVFNKKSVPIWDKKWLKLRQGQTFYYVNSVEAGEICIDAIKSNLSEHLLFQRLRACVRPNLVLKKACVVYMRKVTTAQNTRVSWDDLYYFSAQVAHREFYPARGKEATSWQHDTYSFSERAGLILPSGDWLNEHRVQHLNSTSKRTILRWLKQIAQNPYGYAAACERHKDMCATLDGSYDSWYDPVYDAPEYGADTDTEDTLDASTTQGD